MICYKDKTFCDFKNCTEFDDCTRALTQQVKFDAWDWWNKGKTGVHNPPPICTYSEKPDCFSLGANHD